MSSARKPEWLKVRLPSGDGYFSMVRMLKENGLHTVCQEAHCPNIAECFGRKTATFMILGDTCTRNCAYCDVKHGRPDAPDTEEPSRIARAVKELGLRYVVITSVARDDLEDGGASMFARTIEGIRELNPDCKTEVLIPDFQGDEKALQKVLDARPDMLNHNIEVVRRLFPMMRAHGDYDRSLGVLEKAKECSVTKSGFMVGLGETKQEIIDTMEDLCSVTDILTIGQYLRPSEEHARVFRYYTPGEFEELKQAGLDMGFRHVESGPLVRSSYHAGDYGSLL